MKCEFSSSDGERGQMVCDEFHVPFSPYCNQAPALDRLESFRGWALGRAETSKKRSNDSKEALRLRLELKTTLES